MSEANAIFAPDALAAGNAGPLYLRLKALIQERDRRWQS